VGLVTGEQTDLLEDTSFVAAVDPEIMEVDDEDCEADDDEDCRDAILGWTVGLTNAAGETRCAAPGSDCNVFGAIYHATPRMVTGAPNEFLRDESYAEFARAQKDNERPSILYAATIDGQVHAMKTAPHSPDPEDEVDTLSNNELWSFFPPAVLPVLQSQYPNTPATLLDGALTTRDVPSRLQGEDLFFERTQADAEAAAGGWATVLVQGFGKGQVGAGFFALDITNPVEAEGGPRFLWQLTRDEDDNELFGQGGTPLITTVFLKSSSMDPGKEVAVAVLPGGDKGSRSGALVGAGPLMDPEDETFAPALQVNGYTGAEAARSLTVVRLDTGEVIRSFRTTTTGTTLNASRITVVDIPAPIVGQPAAFPGATGSVADRIFVGDREGRIWRLDVSSSNPSAWTMDVFFDVYFDQLASKRQPIELAPVVSVDPSGQITVAAATGDQRVQTAESGMLNRVVSLTEVLSESYEFQAKVNWVETLGCQGACQADQSAGERVTGPMSLFGGILYFAASSPRASSQDQCAVGTSRVWGLNYTLSADEAEGAETIDPMNGAAGGLPPPPDGTEPEKNTDSSPGMVFGVSIEQQPSCSSVVSDFEGDPYLGGYGEHTALSSATPAQFFLVYQVGGVSGSTSNKVTTEKLELSAPRNTLWVDSWAPIFE
jgi:type IV pilus assembly protein PilY1